MKQEITDKIKELNAVLEKHADKDAVSFTLFINCEEVTASFTKKNAAKLKQSGITMRNIAGRFIL